MANEEATNIDSRVSQMSDEEICGILIDKDGWQEAVYARAIVEAKKRHITLEKIQSKHQQVEAAKAAIATEPLNQKEKWMFLLASTILPVGVVLEKYRAEGYAKKLEQAKFYKMIGKPMVFAAFLVVALLYVYIRSLLEPNY